MKFSIEKFKIAELLSQADSVIEQKTFSLVFSNLLLEAEEGKIIISATDSVTFFKAYDDANVTEKGKTLVNAKKLFDIVKSVPDTLLYFETNENNELIIYSENHSFEFELKTMDYTEYNISFDISFDNSFEVDSQIFKEMIHKTIFSASDEADKQFSTAGVMVEKKDNKINVVATDKKRLAVCKNFEELPDLISIIPKKMMNIILKVRSADQKFKISLTEKKFSIEIGSIQYMSHLLEPKFPNYRTLIQDTFTYTAIIEKDIFNQNLKMISSMFSNEDTILIKIEKNTMIISNIETDIGKGKVNFEIDYDNEPVEFAVSYKNIADFTRVIDCSMFKLCFNNPQKAIFFMPFEEKKDYNYIFITVPVKI
ncbi:MAG: DNA polymerase III subunit beta [Spirochaetota bacterium]